MQGDDSTVIYSITDSVFTDEAEEVRAIIDELDQIFARQQTEITPTGQTDVGAVLQQRLFEDIDFEAGAAIAGRYFHFYEDAPRMFPEEVTSDGYREKLERENKGFIISHKHTSS